MKLLTKDILARLPKLGAGENKDQSDVRVIVKFFNPMGAGTWYATEYDPKERLFFGIAHIFEAELGYFSLDELESFRGPFGLGIERDLHYTGETLKEVMERGH